MTDPTKPTNGNTTRRLALYLLTGISVCGLVGGIVIAYLGQPVGAIISVVVGCVGGMVSIVLRDNQQ